jgi:predicted transglutaminase-like cysteine proteinase
VSPLPQRPCPPSRRSAGRVLGLLTAACLLLAGIVPVISEPAGIVLTARMLDRAEQKYGSKARARLVAWQQLIASARGLPGTEQLQRVNDFFNRIPFVADAEHWGREDYWATPTEMLASNGGDCEDFSIAKYFTLVAVGVPVDKLKITYVKTRDWNPVNQSHMVLTYYSTADAIPLVLDNLIPEIKPASQRPDLTPVYAFNGAGLWLAKERGEGRAVAGGSGKIGFWRELTARMGKEFD